ncbi:putative dynein light chain, type protein [Helianthus annuus]|nr:putative dynein light chain, type protein [Helianthus annuus]
MMDSAQEELERRSKFLSSLIQKKKAADQEQKQVDNNTNDNNIIRVRASDMAIGMQNNAFKCSTEYLHSIPPGNGNGNVKKIDSKRLALALKKVRILFSLVSYYNPLKGTYPTEASYLIRL